MADATMDSDLTMDPMFPIASGMTESLPLREWMKCAQTAQRSQGRASRGRGSGGFDSLGLGGLGNIGEAPEEEDDALSLDESLDGVLKEAAAKTAQTANTANSSMESMTGGMGGIGGMGGMGGIGGGVNGAYSSADGGYGGYGGDGEDHSELLMSRIRVSMLIAEQLVNEQEAVENLQANLEEGNTSSNNSENCENGHRGVKGVKCTTIVSPSHIQVHFAIRKTSSASEWFEDAIGTLGEDAIFSSAVNGVDGVDGLGAPQAADASDASNGSDAQHKGVTRCYLTIDSVELCEPAAPISPGAPGAPISPGAPGHAEMIYDKESYDKHTMLRLQSLGMVLYELFSGETPGEDPMGMATDSDGREVHFRSALNLNDDHDYQNHHDGDDGDDYEFQSQSRKKRGGFASPSQPHTSHTNGHTNLLNLLPNMDLSSALLSLRLTGLPSSLCDLLANLLECSQYEFASNTAYQNVMDVYQDLKNMAFHPKKYLRDVDVLTESTLQLSGKLFGRLNELSLLSDAYHRNKQNKQGRQGQQNSHGQCNHCKAAFLAGASGTGKSKLAEKVKEMCEEDGGFFVAGKFDQLQQLKPFSAIALALNQFCDLIVEEMMANEEQAQRGQKEYRGQGGATKEVMAKEMWRVLGRNAMTLAGLIPGVCRILNVPVEEARPPEDMAGAQNRLQYMLSEFMQLALQFSKKNVTLFLDDIQWADNSSLALLKSLLTSTNMRRGFFLLCCYRDDALTEEHPLATMLTEVSNAGVPMTMIELEDLDRESVNMLISDTLCLSPRLTRPLAAIIFNMTLGNPLFVEQLLISLSTSGLLHLSLSSRRWEWDEDRIQAMDIPDSVVQVMIEKIQALSHDTQESLKATSCFGSCVSTDVLEILSMVLELDLIHELDFAVEAGFMKKIGNQYHFSHDRVQQAAYETIAPEEREMCHFRFGLALSAHVLADKEKELLFVSVDQVNRGGPACVTDVSQREVIARLNLTAGEKAVGLSDFSTAYQFFDFGISFLPKGHWKDKYDLSLSLFQSAVEVSYALGDRTNMQLLTSQILTYAKSFDDKLISYYVIIDSLGSAGKLQECIDKGYEVLSKLDDEFLGTSEKNNFDEYLHKTNKLLEGSSDEEILLSPLMVDPSKSMAMKIYNTMLPYLFLSNPAERNLIILRMVNMSLADGICSASPCCFANFGAILATKGNLNEGRRFGKLALSLIEGLEAKESAGTVYAVVYTQIMCFTEPLQSAIEPHLDGYKAAMLSGDVNCALRNLHYYNIGCYLCGKSLPDVKIKIEDWFGKIVQYSLMMWLGPVLPLYNTILKLMGDAEPRLPRGEFPTEDTILEKALKGKRTELCNMIYFYRMFVSFIFQRHEDLETNAEAYFQSKSDSNVFKTASIAFILFEGLVAYGIAKRKNKEMKWIARGDRALSRMETWLQFSTWTFENKLSMLKAERASLFEEPEEAAKQFEKAIESGQRHRFNHEVAIACELAGNFSLGIGKTEDALRYYSQAHTGYTIWGALAKAEQLRDYLIVEVNFDLNTMPRVEVPKTEYFDDGLQKKRMVSLTL